MATQKKGPAAAKRKLADSDSEPDDTAPVDTSSPTNADKNGHDAAKRKLDEADNDNAAEAGHDQPPTKKSRPSTGAAAAPPAQDGAKPITGAGLSALTKAKRDPSQRTQPASRRMERAAPKPREPSPLRRTPSPPRQRKRPGAAGRVSTSGEEAVRRRQEERDRAVREAENASAVAQHYNAVPERGREWRQSDSAIKGLRNFNNWVKSALIQKFSPSDSYMPGARQHGQRFMQAGGLRVLDIGCGKGGDLGKWQNAPQGVEVYVGLDPAAVSVDQARDRYHKLPRVANRGDFRGRPLFHAEFFAKDCFGEPLDQVPIIRNIGIDFGRGPGSTGGGFDVVSMMFCMHYAFENEQRARGMLKNVAGALKRGGRFLGVIPNSDVLSAHVKALANGGKHSPNGLTEANADNLEDGEVARSPLENYSTDDEDWDPEKPSEPQTDGAGEGRADVDEAGDEWDPEKPSEPASGGGDDKNGAARGSSQTTTPAVVAEAHGIKWGNSKYRVEFPGAVPKSGVFRPSYGWKYFFFLEEAVESVPEFVVPWEAFRGLAAEYDLELQYRRSFHEVWNEEKNDRALGELSERMGVRDRRDGQLLVSKDEMEASSFYHAFCFQKL